MAFAAAREKKTIDVATLKEIGEELRRVPKIASEILQHDKDIETIAKKIVDARDMLYLGRGGMYPLALEGALKMKEISYIHAEGYAAGEMKHGPIALIDANVPVVALAPSDALFEKTASNIQETIARGGKVLLISDEKGTKALKSQASWTITLGDIHPFIAPILYAIPIQLLAYHVAVAKGTDVDQPRNLAKSVTVE